MLCPFPNILGTLSLVSSPISAWSHYWFPCHQTQRSSFLFSLTLPLHGLTASSFSAPSFLSLVSEMIGPFVSRCTLLFQCPFSGRSLSSTRPLHVQVPWISVLSPLSSYILSVNDLVHPMDVDAIDSLTTPTLILTAQGLTLSSVYSFIQLPP